MSDESSVIPEEGTSGISGASEHVRGALSFLSASFVQERMRNVEQRATEIINRIIDFGLLADGFGPFESPVTDDMILRMTPDQLETFLSTIPSEQEKAQILAVIAKLKLPGRVAMPQQTVTHSPAPAPKLAFTPADRVNSQGSSV